MNRYSYENCVYLGSHFSVPPSQQAPLKVRAGDVILKAKGR